MEQVTNSLLDTFLLYRLISSAGTWKPPYFISDDTEQGRERLWFQVALYKCL